MMNKPTIVLLTDVFPYTKTGESFLETEIKYYNKIDDIFIFPLIEDYNNEKRGIPGNCYVYVNTKAMKKTARRICVALQIFTLSGINEILNLFFKKRFNFYNFKLSMSYIYKGKKKFKFIKKILLSKGIKKDKVFIFYSYWMHHNAYTAVLLKKYFKKSKSITRCHRYDLYEEHSKNNFIPLREYIFKNIDAVFPIAQDGYGYIAGKYSVQPKILQVMKLGTMNYGLQKSKRNINKFTIFSCSSIIKVKRLHLLIAALGMLDALENIEIDWIHFGDGDLFYDIKTLADKKLGKAVKFKFMGMVENKEVLKFYQNNYCNLFINVSESEGIPVSIMEAASFAIPVIATDVGGSGELVKNGYNGFLLEKDFAESELRDLILKLYNMNEDEYNEFRINSRKMWENNHNADRVYPEFLKRIENL